MPTQKESELQNKIIGTLLSRNYKIKTLKKIWTLTKGEWQK